MPFLSIAELEDQLRQASAVTSALEDAANDMAVHAERLRVQADAAHRREMQIATQLERAREIESMLSKT